MIESESVRMSKEKSGADRFFVCEWMSFFAELTSPDRRVDDFARKPRTGGTHGLLNSITEFGIFKACAEQHEGCVRV